MNIAIPGATDAKYSRVAMLLHWSTVALVLVPWLFYILLLLQPLMGYLSSAFSPYPSSYFGIPLPDWSEHRPQLNEFFTELHVAGSVGLLLVIALHVLGALSHLVTPGDRLLRRMLPW